MGNAVQAVLEKIIALNMAVKRGDADAKDFAKSLFREVEQSVNHDLGPADAEALLMALERMLPAKTYERMVEYVIQKRSSGAGQDAGAKEAPDAAPDLPPPVPQAGGAEDDLPPPLPTPGEAPARPARGTQAAMAAMAPPIPAVPAGMDTPPDSADSDGFTVTPVPMARGPKGARSFVLGWYPAWCLVTYFYNDDALRMAGHHDTPGLRFEMWHAAITGPISLLLGILVYRNVRLAFPLTKIFLAIIVLSAFYLAFMHEYLWLSESFIRYPEDFSGSGEVWSKAFSYMFEDPRNYIRLVYAGFALAALFLLGGPPKREYPWRQ